MIALETIKHSIIKMLSVTEFTIYGENNEDQLVKPCLLVNIMPIAHTRQNAFEFDKSTIVDIVYLTEESKKINNYAMVDSFQTILSQSVDVDDRHLSILNLTFNIVENVLHAQFTLNYLDAQTIIPPVDPIDLMEKLNINVGE